MADPMKKEMNNSNSFVFFDIGIGSKKGRVVFELFDDGAMMTTSSASHNKILLSVTPKCAENFRCLCTGEKVVPTHPT